MSNRTIVWSVKDLDTYQIFENKRQGSSVTFMLLLIFNIIGKHLRIENKDESLRFYLNIPGTKYWYTPELKQWCNDLYPSLPVVEIIKLSS